MGAPLIAAAGFSVKSKRAAESPYDFAIVSKAASKAGLR
jgi:hypothetical protein